MNRRSIDALFIALLVMAGVDFAMSKRPQEKEVSGEEQPLISSMNDKKKVEGSWTFLDTLNKGKEIGLSENDLRPILGQHPAEQQPALVRRVAGNAEVERLGGLAGGGEALLEERGEFCLRPAEGHGVAQAGDTKSVPRQRKKIFPAKALRVQAREALAEVVAGPEPPEEHGVGLEDLVQLVRAGEVELHIR